jgi:hypothetical protein
MEATKDPQPQTMPPFYPQYAPYYSYELKRLASFPLVFTYRRIWSPTKGQPMEFGGVKFTAPTPGDISMQNWTWGNDYRPGTSADNLIYTRQQLQASGQLQPGGWIGGLRTEALRKGEEISLGYYHWLTAGNTDSQLGDGVKQPEPNHRFLSGLDSPMGTAHGCRNIPICGKDDASLDAQAGDNPKALLFGKLISLVATTMTSIIARLYRQICIAA